MAVNGTSLPVFIQNILNCVPKINEALWVWNDMGEVINDKMLILGWSNPLTDISCKKTKFECLAQWCGQTFINHYVSISLSTAFTIFDICIYFIMFPFFPKGLCHCKKGNIGFPGSGCCFVQRTHMSLPRESSLPRT